MAEVLTDTPVAPGALTGVPWHLYRQLRRIPEMRNRRMTYLDGTLIIMSPEYIHESSADLLGIIVWSVASASAIPFCPARMTTLWRKGLTRKRGSGKEPDTSFYVGASTKRMKGKRLIDLKVDPPPDLVIEVDNKADSTIALTLYARLGVPEVWIHRVNDKTIWFGKLVGDQYASIERSIALPRLTPAPVIDALAAYDQQEDAGLWNLWLQDWVRALPSLPA
jgi:Uma2 family endonuclease